MPKAWVATLVMDLHRIESHEGSTKQAIHNCKQCGLFTFMNAMFTVYEINQDSMLS